jgi:CRISPR-associated protein Csy3
MAKPKTSDVRSFETGMLSYARSLQISDGFFFGKNGKNRIPVEVFEKGVRGQTSNDIEQNEREKKNAGKSNPQTVEFATLPQGCTAVELNFSLRVLPMAMRPHACGDTVVGASYIELADMYAKVRGFSLLAELYVWNIANARFAWRNRFQVDTSTVTISFGEKTIVFNPSSLSLEKPANVVEMTSAIVEGKGNGEDLKYLIDQIEDGFREKPFVCQVTWTGDMVNGQEIFPSQEYVRTENVKENLARVYAKLPTLYYGKIVQQAYMHPQKIGAALRHIDMWHGDSDYGPIAVNPYGGVQETSAILRISKNSFYDIRRNAKSILDSLSMAKNVSEVSNEVHFMMANLVRGGVFGMSTKDKKTDKTKKANDPINSNTPLGSEDLFGTDNTEHAI